ncbi:unnamed protein product [Caenorhabditis sp. 36 PRJEB53466]|nr:unnamed protein product [Caenorhabditis sp. 36 PRJEB53466]
MLQKSSIVLFLLIATSSLCIDGTHAVRAFPQAFQGVEPGIQFELLTAKRADGYGWNDCEFSPLSCLLKRRRRRSVE